MEGTSNTYITCYIKRGKVINQIILHSPDEAKTMEALGRSKGYETETLILENFCSTKKHAVEEIATLQTTPNQQKHPWNKWVRCVETGQLFPSVTECSNQMGLPYKSVWNAINNGCARAGYHFVFERQHLETYKNMEGCKTKGARKILCVSTGVSYQSVKECLHECNLHPGSFYRALNKGKPINGLLFKYI